MTDQLTKDQIWPLNRSMWPKYPKNVTIWTEQLEQQKLSKLVGNYENATVFGYLRPHGGHFGKKNKKSKIDCVDC